MYWKKFLGYSKADIKAKMAKALLYVNPSKANGQRLKCCERGSSEVILPNSKRTIVRDIIRYSLKLEEFSKTSGYMKNMRNRREDPVALSNSSSDLIHGNDDLPLRIRPSPKAGLRRTLPERSRSELDRRD